MKIKKNASVNSATTTENTPSAELNSMVFSDSIEYVKKAIDSLGAYARRSNDTFAKETIANLSVVLMDLKSHISE